MNLVDELHAIAAALRAANVPYAVCGGVAVTVHGATRTTKDIDLVVRRDDVPRVLEALRTLGYLFVSLPMTFEAGTPHERHVQRVTKVEGDQHLMVDLLLAEAALEGALDDRLIVTLDEGPIEVVSRSRLLAMKRLAARPQDLADVQKLEDDGGS